MSAKTAIEWTDYSWNPVSGCDKVSPGCDHCYAETIATRFAGTKAYPDGFKVTLKPERMTDPLRKRSWRGKRVFVNSMSDLFHADVPDEYIAQVFAVMALTPDVTYQVLTKRHGRMRSLLSSEVFRGLVWRHAASVAAALTLYADGFRWPLPNVWLGVSVEDQKRADLRIPALLDTPAAVRWLSCEPLLGPVDLGAAFGTNYGGDPREDETGVDWVVVGGESGTGARPMHPEWARILRDQCEAGGVPFHFKQWGEWSADLNTLGWPADGTYVNAQNGSRADEITAMQGGTWTLMGRVGKKVAGRELDGRTWDEWPVMAR